MNGLDLFQPQRALGLLFVYAVLLGFALGVPYDLLSLLKGLVGVFLGRQRQRGGKYLFSAVAFLTDLVFSLVVTLALILLFYYANDGVFRGWGFWGTCGGFLLHRLTLGRLFSKLLSPLLKWVSRGVEWSISRMKRPVEWLRKKAAEGARAVCLRKMNLLPFQKCRRSDPMGEGEINPLFGSEDTPSVSGVGEEASPFSEK